MVWIGKILENEDRGFTRAHLCMQSYRWAMAAERGRHIFPQG